MKLRKDARELGLGTDGAEGLGRIALLLPLNPSAEKVCNRNDEVNLGGA